jgi:hypothetical protein
MERNTVMTSTFCKFAIFSLILVSPLLTSCTSNNEKTSRIQPEFETLKPAPANPLHGDLRIQDSTGGPIGVVPPAGHGPVVRVLQDGNIVKGERSLGGRIVSTSSNTITFKPNQGSEITIGFALPANMKLKTVTDANGHLFVSDKSSLAGKHETVVVRKEANLLFAYIWRFSEKPIPFELAAGVRLLQEDSRNAASVLLETPTGRQKVAAGKPLEFTVGRESYTAFVQTSIFQHSSGKGDDTESGYVLRALVIGN